jgi:alkylated DNA repair dioxygenase AlkB
VNPIAEGHVRRRAVREEHGWAGSLAAPGSAHKTVQSANARHAAKHRGTSVRPQFPRTTRDTRSAADCSRLAPMANVYRSRRPNLRISLQPRKARHLSDWRAPPWATDLAVRLRRDGLLPDNPDQMVANDYQPGSGIFPHVDQPEFGDTIACVSLGSTCVMRFSDSRSARVEELLLEPRSVLTLSAEARWAWKHEIPARAVDRWKHQERPRSRRVSLTFRVMPRASKGDTHADSSIRDGRRP